MTSHAFTVTFPYNDRDTCEGALADFLLADERGEKFRAHVAGRARDRSLDKVPGEAVAVGSIRLKPFVVNAMELFDSLPDMYQLLSNWTSFNDLLQSGARRAIGKLGDCDVDIRLRLAHVPGSIFSRASVSQLRVADVGSFVRFVGTVTRAGAVKVVQEWRDFKCEQCGHTFRARASPEAGYEFEIPKECASGQKRSQWDAKAKRPKTVKCHSKSFLSMPCAEDCMTDFQEVRVQDHMHAVSAGVVPGSIAIVLFGEQISQIQPGDSVSIEGVVWQRWKSPFQGKRLEIELFVEASHVERLASNSLAHTAQINSLSSSEFEQFWNQQQFDKWEARSKIVHAVAPWLSGLPVPKLALLLTLIGGSPQVDFAPADGAQDTKWGKYLDSGSAKQGQESNELGSSSTGTHLCEEVGSASNGANSQEEKKHTRTTPHILLLGDPGTGKSQLLQAAHDLAGRSVRTSGLGCSSAGLTCAAIRDGPDFVLEAGALVLADGGVCCIDEFSTIRSHDRAAVHEAMEQQTVSVAKAGLVSRLRSQCSVVAAQNCKRGSARGRGGSYDCNSSVAVNSGLPPPLLSRFDLVVVFAEDGKGAATEKEKADCILSACTAPFDNDGGNNKKPETSLGFSSSKTGEGFWGHDKLREYIVWAKQALLGEAPDSRADQVISTYFCVLRKSASQGLGHGGVTVRTLQSLLRLAQAHARLMHHSHVKLEDAIAVIVLHRAALQDRVVGADMSVDGDDCAPTMRDKEDETPACEVQFRIRSVELHHGSDISNQSTYELLERHVLKSLQLRKQMDGSLTVDNELPMLPPCPTPQQQPMPIMDGVPPSQSVSSNASQDVGTPSQGHPQGPKPARGRNLGCRLR